MVGYAAARMPTGHQAARAAPARRAAAAGGSPEKSWRKLGKAGFSWDRAPAISAALTIRA